MKPFFRLAPFHRLILIPVLCLSGCYGMHGPPEREIRRIDQAKFAEMRYAHQLETQLQEMLTALYPPQALRVQVSVQLDFDKSRQNERIVGKDQRLIEAHSNKEAGEAKEAQNESRKTADKSQTKSSKVLRFQPSFRQRRTIVHPGRIVHLGIAVLIDKKYLGDQDPDELKDQLSNLLMAASPYNEDRGDKIEILILPFRPGEGH
jgi:flagellar biosynthesis/type III secretory pathway M-ring protein FliF/YscJ